MSMQMVITSEEMFTLLNFGFYFRSVLDIKDIIYFKGPEKKKNRQVFPKFRNYTIST